MEDIFSKLKGLSRLPSIFRQHPLSEDRVLESCLAFAKHQVKVRLQGEVIHPWIGDSRLAITKWMPGATGNVYSGLQEFPDMGFVLHFVRPPDVFFDVGANVGVYAILASKVRGARSYAFEPDPVALERLHRNIELNDIADLVSVHPAAVGATSGEARFSVGLDVLNHLVEDDATESRSVPMISLDAFDAPEPTLMKIDVEGFEDQVIAGALETLRRPSLLAVLVENANDEIVATLAEAGLQKVFYDPRGRKLGSVPNGLKPWNSLFVRDIDQCRQRLQAAEPFVVLGRTF